MQGECRTKPGEFQLEEFQQARGVNLNYCTNLPDKPESAKLHEPENIHFVNFTIRNVWAESMQKKVR